MYIDIKVKYRLVDFLNSKGNSFICYFRPQVAQENFIC